MTSYAFGAITVLAVWGWGPRLRAYADQLHRRSARRTKERGLPLWDAHTENWLQISERRMAAAAWHGETTREFHAMTQPLVRHLAYDESEET